MSKDLIDRDALMEEAHWIIRSDGTRVYAVHAEDVENSPTVDAVPVVRCRDCKYHSGRIPGQPNIICFQMHEDDFCSYGEPKEDTNE